MAGNRLLPFLALAILAILVLVGVRSCGGPGDSTAMKEVPQAAAPDADTPADTIRTLTARLGEVQTWSGMFGPPRRGTGAVTG